MELTVSDINELVSTPCVDKSLAGTYFRVHPRDLNPFGHVFYQKVIGGAYSPPRGEGLEVLEIALRPEGEAKMYTHNDPFYRDYPFAQITQEEFEEAFRKAVDWLTAQKDK